MRIHYFAAARAAAGVSEEAAGEHATLELVLADACQRHPELEPILPRCSFLVDGMRAELDASLAGAERVDVLPPFAGG
ncbi:MoaD/ThiS family protein [Corynebacterium sp. TA-R-1]|uniref:MoaD/ThiS family protein n=1 Tax=Corynebacterium stercoris TaxID=2943490 RepID=A0ABT1G2P4_9CORY|nr:MoaD/ThiS family protein [Corynebacterium stercoris]MCP1387328.1 MoaD/ThiS family protein [Corynebacterium stercoris]